MICAELFRLFQAVSRLVNDDDFSTLHLCVLHDGIADEARAEHQNLVALLHAALLYDRMSEAERLEENSNRIRNRIGDLGHATISAFSTVEPNIFSHRAAFAVTGAMNQSVRAHPPETGIADLAIRLAARMRHHTPCTIAGLYCSDVLAHLGHHTYIFMAEGSILARFYACTETMKLTTANGTCRWRDDHIIRTDFVQLTFLYRQLVRGVIDKRFHLVSHFSSYSTKDNYDRFSINNSLSVREKDKRIQG